MIRVTLTLVALMCLVGSLMASDIPYMVNVQGKLTDAAGAPLPDDDYVVTFTICDDSTGGVIVWQQTRLVEVRDGLFAELLGKDDGIISGDVALPLEVFNQANRYLGIKVATDPEMMPRQQVVAMPYAYYAETADHADTADYVATAAYAEEAGHADNADHALSADSATVAGHAHTAGYADEAAHAGNADYATDAGHAVTADNAEVADYPEFDYDSGWFYVSAGNCSTKYHNLGGSPDDYIVIVDGKNSQGIHRAHYGTCIWLVPGQWRGVEWNQLDENSITVCRGDADNQADERDWDQVRIRIIADD